MDTDSTAIATDTTVSDVSATVTPPAATESAVATQQTKADTAPATPAEPQSRRDIIRDAMNKPSNNRGRHAAYQPREAGKFAPGSPAVPVQTQDQALQVPQRPAMIKSLKKELEPHWNNAPPELLEAFAQREADFEKGAQTWKSKAEQADAVLNEFKPYEWILRNEGTTPQAAIGPLLQTAAILRTGTPAQKAHSVANIMRQYGIPVEHISATLGQGNPAVDPQYDHLAQRFSRIEQAQMMQEQAQSQRTMSIIEQFGADPNHQHFAELQDKMLALLQTPHLLGSDLPYLSETDKLERAYQTALRLDTTLSAQVSAQQQTEQQRVERERQQAAAIAAKAAAVQVRGAPSASTVLAAVNPNDRRAVIANALRAVQH